MTNNIDNDSNVITNIRSSQLVAFRSEIVLTKTLVHPNIVKLVGITVSKELLGCILEFVQNGTLEDVLDKVSREEISMSWSEEKVRGMQRHRQAMGKPWASCGQAVGKPWASEPRNL